MIVALCHVDYESCTRGWLTNHAFPTAVNCGRIRGRQLGPDSLPFSGSAYACRVRGIGRRLSMLSNSALDASVWVKFFRQP